MNFQLNTVPYYITFFYVFVKRIYSLLFIINKPYLFNQVIHIDKLLARGDVH